MDAREEAEKALGDIGARARVSPELAASRVIALALLDVADALRAQPVPMLCGLCGRMVVVNDDPVEEESP